MYYTTTKYIITICLGLIISLGFAMTEPALAQNKPAHIKEKITTTTIRNNNRISQRIVRPMVPLDAVTLQAEGIKISLWGVKIAHTSETPLELSALAFVEKIIGGEPVSCKIEAWKNKEPLARCTVHTNEDLALALLQAGYAVVDRHQTYNSVFASSYDDAQNNARKKRAGIWKLIVHKKTENLIPEWLSPYMPNLVPLSLIFGPIIGLLMIAVATRRGFAKILKSQEIEFNETRHKEETLLRREKLVLAAALEGELSENRIKIESFLTIYQSILDELNADDITHKYQKGGDLIHKHPALNRTVFEGCISKLSALDMHNASTLSKLYTHIYAEPDYKTIAPSVPLNDVINMVKQTIKGAQDLIPQIDYAVEQLQATMQEQLNTATKKTTA